MTRILVLEEISGNRYFIVREESDLNRIALKILRERSATGRFYASTKEARDQLSIVLEEIRSNEENFVNAAPPLDTSEAAKEVRRTLYRDLKEKIEKKYLSALEFAEKLEELLSLTDEEALTKYWIFEDGQRLELAYTLLTMRRHIPHEGFSFVPAEDY